MPCPDLMLEGFARLASDPVFRVIGGATIALAAFSKSAFGGGAASSGVSIRVLAA